MNLFTTQKPIHRMNLWLLGRGRQRRRIVREPGTNMYLLL